MDSPNVKDLIIASGFKFNKALGQNFVTDKNLLNAIVDDALVTDADTVVEIGTGAGTLTRAIAQKAKQVISFEVDKNLAPVLDLSLKGLENVTVVFKDVLKMQKEEFEKIVSTPFKVVANLPYYVTTPMIMHFLESDLPVISVTVMVQKEVAERLVAKEGTKNYAAITLGVKMRGEAHVTRGVSRQMFYPQPNVDSAVVNITIDKDKLPDTDLKKLSSLVKCAFSMRRKMLTNNLMSGYSISREAALDILKRADISPTVRGEALSLDDFVRILKVMEG